MSARSKRNYRVPEAETVYGFTQRNLRYLIASRQIAVVKVGRNVYIPESELDRLVRDGSRPAGDAA